MPDPGRDHLKTGPFEIQPPKCPVFECFQFSKGRFSDPHCISNSSVDNVNLGLENGVGEIKPFFPIK